MNRPWFETVTVNITQNELHVLESLILSVQTEHKRTGLWGYYIPDAYGGLRLQEFIDRVDAAIETSWTGADQIIEGTPS